MATVQSLLNKALYKSLNDRVFNPIEPAGGIINVALDIFNDVLSDCKDLIPFSTTVLIKTNAGLENTTFNNIVTLNYVLNGVRYPVERVDEIQYAQRASVVTIGAPPAMYMLDHISSKITPYPMPTLTDTDYFEVVGFPAQGDVLLNADIPTSMPRFMQTYIVYSVASRLCDESNAPWSDKKEATLRQSYNTLIQYQENDLSPDIDLPYGRPSSSKAGWPLFGKISGGNL